MNILTGIVFCVFTLMLTATRGAKADSKEADLYAHVSAYAFLCLILCAGHWLAVLLGKL